MRIMSDAPFPEDNPRRSLSSVSQLNIGSNRATVVRWHTERRRGMPLCHYVAANDPAHRRRIIGVRWCFAYLVRVRGGGCLECLTQVGDDVVHVLDADREANGVFAYATGELFLDRKLLMGCRGWMDDE